ncbi:MAG TPA: hypothetical protein VEH04_16785 [Verrucomicrobiae bacterium]|nr:hypothetical protein [Verrucomicrobiae bacterium]
MTGAIKDGDMRFARGLDSASDPSALLPESYAWSVNMLNRGGVLQTRPGYRQRFTLPEGKLQGLTVFTPRVGTPVLIAIVAGKVYTSHYPFTSYQAVVGDQLSATADHVFAEQATRSVERNPDGSLKLISPQSVLMLQDGKSPAAYFDGYRTTSTNSVPQGTHMKWVSGRLWVARGPQLFASDIADPLNFIEQKTNTLGGINYYLLPDDCTGMATTPGLQLSPLFAFTNSTTTAFQTTVLNRAAWSSLAQFQQTIFPNIGTVSARSIVSRAGLLWWYSQFGLVNFDAAAFSESSSRIDLMDNELARSKSCLSPDLSGIAAASYGNFLLVSVPHASLRNRHTWVHDATSHDLANEALPPCWSSVWTGVNPVQWVRLTIAGRTRLFCASVDDDGQNRVYEAFTNERRDNGVDIPWVVETRGYTGGAPVSPKELRFLEYGLSDIHGQVNLKISWAGVGRGRWKTLAEREFRAAEGNISGGQSFRSDSALFALKSQSRFGRTEDLQNVPEDTLSSAGIDGNVFTTESEREVVDTAFQFRIEGSGQCSVRSLRVFMDPIADSDRGMPDKAETEAGLVRYDGAASRNQEGLQEAPTIFSSTKSAEARYKNYGVGASAAVVSSISQSEADKRALQTAQARADFQLAATVPPYVGGSLAE